jgi:hypothetical protein
MQSPAPQKQQIAGRSDSSEETKEEEEAFDITENIEAITKDKKEEAESDDSSDSTITQREIENKDPPETDGGSIKKAAEALEEEAFDIIENIEAITKDKKEAESDDSSDSTITEVKEDNKDPPETDGGSVKIAVEALEVFAKPSASDGTSESSSSSS